MAHSAKENSIPQDTDINDPAVVAEIAHFRNVPLATATLNDKDFKPVSISRQLTHGGSGHSLMAGTWNTPETIAHLSSFFRSPSRPTTNPPNFTMSDVNGAEIRRFYTIGNGLNAHAGLLHGGVMACLLDSTMSNAAGLTLRAVITPSDTVFTVQLNVKYEKPMRTPGTMMFRAWVNKVESGGRKVWVVAEVSSGDKGEVINARAEGLWLKTKVQKL